MSDSLSDEANRASREDARYRMLVLYSNDLGLAAVTMQLVRKHRRWDLRASLFRDAVVSYARPFSDNLDPSGKSDSLSTRYVPRSGRELHRGLMALRMQLFAHTDGTFHKPRVTRLTLSSGSHVHLIQGEQVDFDGWYARTREIETHIDGVLDLVNGVMRKLTPKFDAYDLPAARA